MNSGKGGDIAAPALTRGPERVACFRMNDIRRRLRALSNTPSKDDDGYDAWLEQADLVEFLEKNAEEEKTVVYASVPGILIFSALVPQDDVDPPDVDDLLGWNGFPRSAYAAGESEFGSEMRVEPSLKGYSSRSLSKGEQLVFNRSLDEVPEYYDYMEILQKFSHVFGLHYMQERSAWCRLDGRGDIENVVEEVDFSSDGSGSRNDEGGGRAVLFDRSTLGEYAAMTGTVLVRMFNCDRGSTWGISEYERQERRSPESGIFYRCGVARDPDASYAKGVQVVSVAISSEEVVGRFRKRRGFDDELHYEKFIASLSLREYDKTAEISSEDRRLAPAFFRPEVLSRYKADPDKYHIGERLIRCRSSWTLEVYDINEAGQVYSFLKYLNRLPREEQMYWKVFNEKPKAPVSNRTIRTGFLGKPDSEYDPLQGIKNKLRYLRCSWWKMRSSSALDRIRYPIPKLKEDWKNEIKALDQLIVEGFDKKYLREKAESGGQSPEPNFGSLKLIQECLVGLGFEENDSHSIVAPFFELHDMRSKFSHREGEKAQKLETEALKNYGSYRAHYKDLAAKCDGSLEKLMEAFEDL